MNSFSTELFADYELYEAHNDTSGNLLYVYVLINVLTHLYITHILLRIVSHTFEMGMGGGLKILSWERPLARVY